MKLDEAIKEIIESNHFNQTIRRTAWSHGDSLVIHNDGGYMGGELYWKYSKNRAELFFVEDICANDWNIE